MATATQESSPRTAEACYVYGILPADVEANADVTGVGDPPGQVTLVRHGEIAALVSTVRTDRPLGRPQDLMTHERLLDTAAREAPVLPIRFGAVLTDQNAVVEELLAPHHDEFLSALEELEGLAQYAVKGRYDERAILSEILSANRHAAALREQIRGKPEDATRELRIQLGELISNEIEARREEDTSHVLESLESVCESSVAREPTHELDTCNVAVLVEVSRQGELEEAVSDLANQWRGRVRLRLLGPLAPYDFVSTAESPEQAG